VVVFPKTPIFVVRFAHSSKHSYMCGAVCCIVGALSRFVFVLLCVCVLFGFVFSVFVVSVLLVCSE